MGNVPRKGGCGGQIQLAESQYREAASKETAEADAKEPPTFQITICVLENEEILISESTPCTLRSPGPHKQNHVT